ncbi:MAG: succinate dehydrogenase/fumarate reductase cytochrome b subunit, partial [Bacteroidia bacterium]|nr:succinate dehydrogenase/fumarate reductase cytochrome b subunit [Bacteroidia bacterium]
WLPRIKMISNIIATLIILMFMAIPVYYLITNLLG